MNAPATAEATRKPTYTPPTDAAESAYQAELREQYQTRRLRIAVELLAGLLAGGKCHSAMSWEAEAVRMAIRLSDRLIVENQRF